VIFDSAGADVTPAVTTSPRVLLCDSASGGGAEGSADEGDDGGALFEFEILHRRSFWLVLLDSEFASSSLDSCTRTLRAWRVTLRFWVESSAAGSMFELGSSDISLECREQ